MTWQAVQLDHPEGTIAGYRSGKRGAPPLLFCHANGFCASAYRQVLLALGDAFDVLAIDLRGHGKTRLPADPDTHRDWYIYGRDIAVAMRAASADFEMRGPWILAGHSLGAVAVTLAAARETVTEISHLALIEPVIPPRSVRVIARTPAWPLLARQIPIMKGAMKRRAHWSSRADAFAHYCDKPTFARFADGVLTDYLADGLCEAPDGTGVALSCAPAWEGATFRAQNHKTIAALRAVRRRDIPVAVLAVDQGSTLSPDGRRALQAIGAVCHRPMTGGLASSKTAGHLIALEDIAVSATFLRQSLDG